MSPVYSADTLWVQNFVEITLSGSVSEINALLRFMQKLKMAAKSGGKVIFVKSPQYTLNTLWVKNLDEIPLLCTVQEIEANLYFSIYGENSKWPTFLGRGKSWKLARVDCRDTLLLKNSDEIALSHTVKETEANLCFCIFGENSKWPPFLGRGIYHPKPLGPIISKL